MGNPRPKPDRLSKKLKQIREAFGLSQTGMLKHLGLEDAMHYSRISEYEQGTREPTLMTLLAYTHAAGVHMEDIVDDAIDLPDNLPGPVKFTGLKRARAARWQRVR